ncbi:hypothetical protein V2J09_006728 [Rumex salicifolius]
MSDYILEDNLVQILKYSPVKTLLRFRSVCKKWKEMIDSSFFIKEHLAVQKPRFIAEYNDERDFLIIDPQIQPLVTTIRDPIEDPTVLFFLFGTLHGVICLFDYCNTLHLWNPSVGKLSTLPLPGYKYLEFSYSGDITQTCYAFWISPSTKEFKVLFFDFYWEDNDERVLDGILYSSIRHDWREIPVGEIWNSCQNGPPLIIGDMAYWRGHYDYVNEQGDVCKAMVILSFDFGKEAFEFIEMPEVKFLRRARHIPYRLQGTHRPPKFRARYLSVQNPQFIVDYGGCKYLVVDPLPCPLIHTLSKPIEQDSCLHLGTFHGVVCLFAKMENIVLWNPSIRRFMIIPMPLGFTRCFLPRHACYGFWIDSSTKEFKILMFLKYPEWKCTLCSSSKVTGVKAEELEALQRRSTCNDWRSFSLEMLFAPYKLETRTKLNSIMLDYISEDNFALIFKYLPVKTLMRFRSVCKWWKELIDSPTFMRDHLGVQKPRFLVRYEELDFLVVDPHTCPPLVDNLSPPFEDYDSILGTHHGVVCCLHGCDEGLLIWNPSIRKSFPVSLPDGFEFDIERNGVRICNGFWIDPLTKEFKIIIVQPKSDVNCILYSSILGDWSVIPGEKVRNWKSCQEDPPIMIGGVAHWRGCYDERRFEDHYGLELGEKLILSFDFKHECFDIIKMPDLGCFVPAIFHWQGKLSIVCWKERFPCRCHIYVREEDSWVEVFGFKMYKHVAKAFWAMEERNEQGKGKKFRVLATISNKSYKHRLRMCELVLSGSGADTNCVSLRKGICDENCVYISYDFVESLLFP